MQSEANPPQPPAAARWEASTPRKNLVVPMGDMLASNDAAAQLVIPSLGSGVGIGAYDPVARVGGLLYAMMADSTVNPERAVTRPFMFVDSGLPAMVQALLKLGALKERLVVKLSGGAEFMEQTKAFNIGSRNIEAALTVIAREGLRVAARETGGRKSRGLKLDLSNGEFILERPGEKPSLL